MRWALCTSTANQTVAPDGDAGHNSPFTQELLSAECGFLKHNVSIQHALETARSRAGTRRAEAVHFWCPQFGQDLSERS